MGATCLSAAVAALLAFGCTAATGGAADPPPVTLTEADPVACFPLDQGTLRLAPTVVRLDIVAVSNPSLKGLNFAVYLIRGGKTWDVGVFSLYPPDHPGVFRLRVDAGLKAAENQSGSAPGDILSVCIVLKAKPRGNSNDEEPALVSVRLLPPGFE